MTDWGALKVVDLRAELRRRGLQPTGLKQELVQRLTEDDTKPTAHEQANTASLPTDTMSALDMEEAAITTTSRDPQSTGAGEAAEARQESSAASPEPKPVAAAAETSQTAALSPSPPTEVSQDAQKRKRRSITPPPDPKRLKADEGALGAEAMEAEPPFKRPDEPLGAQSSLQADEQIVHHSPEPFHHPASDHRTVEPPLHPATRALYIRGFMRPLREEDARVHLHALATPANQDIDEDAIDLFYLDPIRTHAFIIFNETAKAVRARSALHDVTWPEESNRRPLWVDFVPPEKVRGWIAEEDADGHRPGGTKRWEVRYHRNDDGNLTLTLDSNAGPTRGPDLGARFRPAPAQREPPRSAPVAPRNFAYNEAGNANAIPLGPRISRAGRVLPLPNHQGSMDMPGPKATRGYRETQARPTISYQPVSEDLARQRVDAIRSHYTQDTYRDLGREDEINRYTFESGGVFVDRGREVFIGIRPPHREAERQRQLGGRIPPPQPSLPPSFRRGPPGWRPSADRFVPEERTDFQQGGRWRFSRPDEARSGGGWHEKPPRRY